MTFIFTQVAAILAEKVIKTFGFYALKVRKNGHRNIDSVGVMGREIES
jgi:hypothetical protein